MKRLFIILITLFVSLSFWGYPYKVNVTSTLNLRSEPSTTSTILLKLNNGDVVDSPVDLSTISATSDWVRVDYNGTTGYLQAKYLIPAENSTAETKSSIRVKQWYKLLDWEGDGYRWMTYLIGGLVLLMWFECKFLRHLTLRIRTASRGDSRKWAWINGVLLAVTSGSILFYVMQMGSNSLWFFMPSIVNSWWFVILNFIFFIYVLINLLVFFLMTLKDIADTAQTSVSLKFGLYTWLAGIIALVVCGIGGYDPTYIYLIIGVCQVVQVCIILIQLIAKKRFFAALAASLLYVLGSVSIVILASCLVFVLIILAIVAIVFAIALKISSAPGGILSDKDGYPNPHGSQTAEGDYTIINPEGIRTRLTNNNGDIYDGNDGYIYKKTGESFHRI